MPPVVVYIPSATFLEDLVKRHLKLVLLLLVSYIKYKVMVISHRTCDFNAERRKESYIVISFSSSH